MPRIRKKTSKRTKTHQRAKIKNKVKESRKKVKKEAKKNTQWKSKHPKDPGIPNSFPYKEQILAEVAEQRRQAEEAKQMRKEAKKLSASNKAAEEPIVIDGVTDLSGNANYATQTRKDNKPAAGSSKEDEEEASLLKDSEFDCLRAVLDNSDVILHVLDARDPLAYQSTQLFNQFKQNKQRKLIHLLNKIDLCPREAVKDWLTEIRQHTPSLPTRCASAFLPEDHVRSVNNPHSQRTVKSDAIGRDTVLAALSAEASRRGVRTLAIAVVGLANTGKSSIINSLLGKSVCPFYKLSSSPTGPSTTMRAQEVILEHDGKTFRFIDTPALSWEPKPDTDKDEVVSLRAKDVLLRNKGRVDRVKDPLSLIAHIVRRAKSEDLMVHYNLHAFTQGDYTAFLTALARSRGLLKKAGDPDLQAAARIVLRDWNLNKFPWYTLPIPTPSNPAAPSQGGAPSEFVELYSTDVGALEICLTRKEMRSGPGIIKLTPHSADERDLQLDAVWEEEDNESEGGEDGESSQGDGDEVESGMDDDGEEDEDEEEEEDDDGDDTDDDEDEVPTLLPPRSPSPKGKRKLELKVERPSKKVSFGPSNVRASQKPIPSKSRPVTKATSRSHKKK